MKILVELCFVAAVAQAIDVDWTTVKRMDVVPDNINEILENGNWLETPMYYTSHIVGGDQATLEKFPYQTGLLVNTPEEIGFCGGSILNERWVLTAAHCVDVATSVTILFAALDIFNNNSEQFSLVASRIVVHSNWDTSTVQNDIAVLELPEALTYSEWVQPIRLPRRSQASTSFEGFTGTVSGWGRDSDSTTEVSPILRWTSNPILSNTFCNMSWLGIVSNTQICLSAVHGRSSCNGDSGGPLVVTDTDGKTTQIGVVSFGSSRGCTSGWPDVYARISSYLDWIATNSGGSVIISD